MYANTHSRFSYHFIKTMLKTVAESFLEPLLQFIFWRYRSVDRVMINFIRDVEVYASAFEACVATFVINVFKLMQ